MARYIEVTNIDLNHMNMQITKEETILLNMDKVFGISKQGEYSKIIREDSSFFFVKESFETVKNMIKFGVMRVEDLKHFER